MTTIRNKTTLSNMVNPEVMAPMVAKELESKMAFLGLCETDRTLEGSAGDTVSLPKYAYIGDAVDVSEGAPVPVDTLSASAGTATIKKVGRGIELTDEAMLSGYGDPVGEAARQLGQAIANKVDSDVLAALSAIGAEMTMGDGSKEISAALVADGLVKFGDLIDGQKVLLIAPAQLAVLRKSADWIKASDVTSNILATGAVGMIHGCQVVVSNKIVAKTVDGKTVYEDFIVQPGALMIFLKRQPQVEQDRDIINKTTVITADQHYVAYLKDSSKAVKLVTA